MAIFFWNQKNDKNKTNVPNSMGELNQKIIQIKLMKTKRNQQNSIIIWHFFCVAVVENHFYFFFFSICLFRVWFLLCVTFHHDPDCYRMFQSPANELWYLNMVFFWFSRNNLRRISFSPYLIRRQNCPQIKQMWNTFLSFIRFQASLVF